MIDERAAGGPETLWYHTNHQGSTIAMSDDTGSVTETYTYDAFGNSSTLTGNLTRSEQAQSRRRSFMMS